MPKVPLAEHHDVIKAIPSNRADKSLRTSNLPGPSPATKRELSSLSAFQNNQMFVFWALFVFWAHSS
jgi:hypothetical protein